MSFKREIIPFNYSSGDLLTSDLIAIGMTFSGLPAKNPNIEDTLMAASIEAFKKNDGRIRSMLVDWFDVYHPWINADRLMHLVASVKNPEIQRYWCALGQWKRKDVRFKKMSQLFSDRSDLDPSSWRLVEMKGEDPRFLETCLRVPKSFLRSNIEKYIMPPEFLAKRHKALQFRIMMGPSYRADMWAILSSLPYKKSEKITCAEIARQSYGSYATAKRVKDEWKLLNSKVSA